MPGMGHGIIEIKSADASTGAFVGDLSVYGNIDHAGDVCEAGCFTECIKQRGTHYPLLYQHEQDEPIGSFDVTDTKEALRISGKFNLNVRRGAESYALLKAGDVNGLSIGYNVLDYSYDSEGIRHLTKLDLCEGSFVTFPANSLARAEAKSRRMGKMQDYAHMQSLSKLDDATKTAILDELAEMEKRRECGKAEDDMPDKLPEDETVQADDQTADMDKPEDTEEDTSESDLLTGLKELYERLGEMLAKTEE